MRRVTVFVFGLWLVGGMTLADDVTAVEARLQRAGANRAQLEKALGAVHGEAQTGMRFLVEHMPEQDLKTVTAELLIENVRAAYDIQKSVSWKIPQGIFLNNVLPYASINERRDNWRRDFYKRFAPLVKDAKTPAVAAAILNQRVFPMTGVKYSTKRRKADQSPYESMESGLASCTGLSILLIDACRACGIPARFVGTPLWSDGSGNHSWVEIWSNGKWHFTGAAEPTGQQLNRAWFLGRAGKANREHRLHAIYATSFRTTPLKFPMVWNRAYQDISCVNVTDRYTALTKPVPAGMARVRFRCIEPQGGARLRVQFSVRNLEDRIVFSGRTNDDGFDANDHVTAELRLNENYTVTIGDAVTKFTVSKDEQLIDVRR